MPMVARSSSARSTPYAHDTAIAWYMMRRNVFTLRMVSFAWWGIRYVRRTPTILLSPVVYRRNGLTLRMGSLAWWGVVDFGWYSYVSVFFSALDKRKDESEG